MGISRFHSTTTKNTIQRKWFEVNHFFLLFLLESFNMFSISFSNDFLFSPSIPAGRSIFAVSSAILASVICPLCLSRVQFLSLRFFHGYFQVIQPSLSTPLASFSSFPGNCYACKKRCLLSFLCYDVSTKADNACVP